MPAVNPAAYNLGMGDWLKTEAMKSRREKLGLTQAAAAVRAGVSRQRWNDLESGRKTNVELSTLGAIAAALNCRMKDLLN